MPSLILTARAELFSLLDYSTPYQPLSENCIQNRFLLSLEDESVSKVLVANTQGYVLNSQHPSARGEHSVCTPNSEYTVTGRSLGASQPSLISGFEMGWGVYVISRYSWTWLDGKKGHDINEGGQFLREDIRE